MIVVDIAQSSKGRHHPSEEFMRFLAAEIAKFYNEGISKRIPRNDESLCLSKICTAWIAEGNTFVMDGAPITFVEAVSYVRKCHLLVIARNDRNTQSEPELASTQADISQSVTAAKSVGISKPAVTFAFTGYKRSASRITSTDASSVPSPPDSQKSMLPTASNFLSNSAVSTRGDGSSLHQDHHQSYNEKNTNFSGTNNKLRIPVDKICLETGKVLEVFSSAIEAAKSVGLSQAAISLALADYKGRGSAAGFRWRYAGSEMTEAASALAKKCYSEGLQNDEPSETCDEDPKEIIAKSSSSSSDDEDTMDIQSDIEICTSDRAPKRIKVTENGETLGSFSNLLSDLPPEDLSRTTKEKFDRENGFQIRRDINKQDHEQRHEDSNHDTSSLNQDESLESSSNPPNMDGMAGTKIEQVCLLTGKVMGRYDTLQEASTVTGISKKSLQGFVGSVAHGVLWRRVEKSRKFSKRCRINNNENRAVEQLCFKTGEVLSYFGSATEAAESMGLLKGAILRALSEDSDIKTCAGFGWRYLGSTAPPDAVPRSAVISVSAGAGKSRDSHNKKEDLQTSKANITSLPYSNTSKPVQKICLKTGQVLEDFRSTKEAAASVGVSKSGISYVLLGYFGKISCAGFGWRYTNSRTVSKVPPDALPRSAAVSVSAGLAMSRDSYHKKEDHQTSKANITSLPYSNTSKPVEKICLKTGQVLEDFRSTKEAAASVGVSKSGISYVLLGYFGKTSCAGFGWRYTNSRTVSKVPPDALPRSAAVSVSAGLAMSRDSYHKKEDHQTSKANITSLPYSNTSKPVEKICLKTGQVLEDFRSTKEAAASAGVSRTSIGNVLVGYRGKTSCAGFGWRYTNSRTVSKVPPDALPRSAVVSVSAGAAKSRGPHSKKQDHQKSKDDVTRLPYSNTPKAVEKICLKTGHVLRNFRSTTEAAASVGVSKSGIGNVLNGYLYRQGKMPACAGFEWRYTNSRTVSKTTKPELHGSQPSTVSSKPSPYKETPTKILKQLRAPSDLPSGHEALSSSDAVFKGESTTRKDVRPSASPPPTSRNSFCKIPIEQVCLQTGKWLQRFDSIAEASKLTGFVFSHDRMGMGQVSNGFFWRVEGSTALPSHLKELNPSNVLLGITQKPLHTSHLVETSTHFISSPSVVAPPRVSARVGRPVEKYCVKTGRLLARFGSITEAALSVGVAPTNIMAVVSSFKTSKMCMGFGWRHAASAEPPLEAFDDPVPAVSTNAVGVPSHVAGVASVGTYSPQQGDRFRIYYDKVKDAFGERHEAAGWYTGTATDVVPLYDKQHLVYLRFDDQSEDNFLFPAPDIQRILPSAGEQASNKVFAVDGAGALDLAYECSPEHIEVGDVVFCKYQDPDQAEGQWHRGRVAIVHENGTCDVVFDGCDRDCNLETSRFRLMERGRDAKGWLAGLTIHPREKVSSARISRVADDDRIVLTFPDGSEANQGYEQVAATLMKETLEMVNMRSSKYTFPLD